MIDVKSHDKLKAKPREKVLLAVKQNIMDYLLANYID